MRAVARRILMRPLAVLVAQSFSSRIHAQIVSGRAHQRMPFGVLVAATATTIVWLALVILAQTTPSTAHIDALQSSTQRPPPPAVADPFSPKADFQLASRAYIDCSLGAAVLLALRPEIPDLIANAAIKRCAHRARELRQLVIPIAGEGGSLYIMLEVDDLLREHARTLVVTIREEAEQLSRGSF